MASLTATSLSSDGGGQVTWAYLSACVCRVVVMVQMGQLADNDNLIAEKDIEVGLRPGTRAVWRSLTHIHTMIVRKLSATGGSSFSSSSMTRPMSSYATFSPWP